jgi:hypothetical protein
MVTAKRASKIYRLVIQNKIEILEEQQNMYQQESHFNFIKIYLLSYFITHIR